MKSQVIGICGDAVPRAVQKDALTLADTRPAANTSPSRSAAHRVTIEEANCDVQPGMSRQHAAERP